MQPSPKFQLLLQVSDQTPIQPTTSTSKTVISTNTITVTLPTRSISTTAPVQTIAQQVWIAPVRTYSTHHLIVHVLPPSPSGFSLYRQCSTLSHFWLVVCDLVIHTLIHHILDTPLGRQKMTTIGEACQADGSSID